MKTLTWVPIGVLIAAFQLGAIKGQCAPANDNFVNRITISGTNLTLTANNTGATGENAEPSHADNTATRSVWWTWTAPKDGQVTISTAGSTFDTVLAIYRGSSLGSLTLLSSNDDEDYANGISTSRAKFNVTSGMVCQIAVDGYSGKEGTIQLSLTLGPIPPAPAWSCANLQGQSISSSNYAGKVIILDFWATWCGPCVAEIPDLISLQNQYGQDGLVVIGLSVDSAGTQVVSNFVQSNGVNYPVLMANSAVQNAFGGIEYIPSTFIIDRHNIIRASYVGGQTRATFENVIRPLLYGNICMAARRTAGQMALTWPTNGAQFVLETTPTLIPAAWTNTTAVPQIMNGLNTYQLPPASSNRFYRLRLAY
jgi:thiol-disulfide isomerase/thioredoxin